MTTIHRVFQAEDEEAMGCFCVLRYRMVNHHHHQQQQPKEEYLSEATSITSHVLGNVLDKSLLLSILDYNSLTVSDGLMMTMMVMILHIRPACV